MMKHALRISAVLLIAGAFPLIHAQERREERFERARNVISRTMEDVRHIERHEAFSSEDRERYERAMSNLSDAQRDLEDHRLDRERLDRAAEQLERVAHMRMVAPREQDRLMEDVTELRRLRDDWR